MAKKDPNEPVKMTVVCIKEIKVRIRGTADLVTDRMPEEIAAFIQAGQAGLNPPKLKPRSPEQMFRDSVHLLSGEKWPTKPGGEAPRCGYPANAFKKAMIQAANDCGMAMTVARRAWRIRPDDGDLVEIFCDSILMKTDVAKKHQGSKSLVAVVTRAAFHNWYIDLTIAYNASIVSDDQTVTILNSAGFGVGVGSMRPSGANNSSGVMGTWELATDIGKK